MLFVSARNAVQHRCDSMLIPLADLEDPPRHDRNLNTATGVTKTPNQMSAIDN